MYRNRNTDEDTVLTAIIGVFIVIFIILFKGAFLAFISWLLMICYNYVAPMLFVGATTLGFWHALAIIMIIKIIGMFFKRGD